MMAYIAGKLKHRITIMRGVDIPNDNGGFDRGYEKLVSLWSWKKQIGAYLMLIRSQNVEKYNSNAPISSDEFGVRWNSVISKLYRTFSRGFDEGLDSFEKDGMGRSFSGGYDNGYDSLIDMYPIKSDYFVFLQNGNVDAYRGRRYKINRIVRDDNLKEFVILQCSEIEEVGLGAVV
jgi:hypothetical protein